MILLVLIFILKLLCFQPFCFFFLVAFQHFLLLHKIKAAKDWCLELGKTWDGAFCMFYLSLVLIGGKKR